MQSQWRLWDEVAQSYLRLSRLDDGWGVVGNL
jgi:hypothetical protein